jgi:hypothetical protein
MGVKDSLVEVAHYIFGNLDSGHLAFSVDLELVVNIQVLSSKPAFSFCFGSTYNASGTTVHSLLGSILADSPVQGSCEKIVALVRAS